VAVTSPANPPPLPPPLPSAAKLLLANEAPASWMRRDAATGTMAPNFTVRGANGATVHLDALVRPDAAPPASTWRGSGDGSGSGGSGTDVAGSRRGQATGGAVHTPATAASDQAGQAAVPPCWCIVLAPRCARPAQGSNKPAHPLLAVHDADMRLLTASAPPASVLAAATTSSGEGPAAAAAQAVMLGNAAPLGVFAGPGVVVVQLLPASGGLVRALRHKLHRMASVMGRRGDASSAAAHTHAASGGTSLLALAHVVELCHPLAPGAVAAVPSHPSAEPWFDLTHLAAVDEGALFASWFAAAAADAIVVRPDRMVFGAYTAAELPAAVTRLLSVIGRAPEPLLAPESDQAEGCDAADGTSQLEASPAGSHADGAPLPALRPDPTGRRGVPAPAGAASNTTTVPARPGLEVALWRRQVWVQPAERPSYVAATALRLAMLAALPLLVVALVAWLQWTGEMASGGSGVSAPGLEL
jgi:hypothetical protein